MSSQEIQKRPTPAYPLSQQIRFLHRYVPNVKTILPTFHVHNGGHNNLVNHNWSTHLEPHSLGKSAEHSGDPKASKSRMDRISAWWPYVNSTSYCVCITFFGRRGTQGSGRRHHRMLKGQTTASHNSRETPWNAEGAFTAPGRHGTSIRNNGSSVI